MLPPLWSLGFHQCRYGYDDLNHMDRVIDGFQDANLPLDAVWADIGEQMNRKCCCCFCCFSYTLLVSITETAEEKD